MNKKTRATDRFRKTSARVSEVPRGILSSLGSLHPGGRQVAYHFLCDCVFNFKQVGPDTMRCNFHSGVEFSVSGYYAKFQQILISFNVHTHR
ncbi:hypothetical protein V1478_012224 [Vespula squamosa]|uniref:Uncharacterized protein n=1 Tax=Vespula squamosa TaxID=30214 RepID=A0ABD2ACK5_VESSQ